MFLVRGNGCVLSMRRGVCVLTGVDARGQAAAVDGARGHIAVGGRGRVVPHVVASRRGLGGQRGHQVLQRVGVRQSPPPSRPAPPATRPAQRARRRLARLLVLLNLLQQLLPTTNKTHVHNIVT